MLLDGKFDGNDDERTPHDDGVLFGLKRLILLSRGGVNFGNDDAVFTTATSEEVESFGVFRLPVRLGREVSMLSLILLDVLIGVGRLDFLRCERVGVAVVFMCGDGSPDFCFDDDATESDEETLAD